MRRQKTTYFPQQKEAILIDSQQDYDEWEELLKQPCDELTSGHEAKIYSPQKKEGKASGHEDQGSTQKEGKASDQKGKASGHEGYDAYKSLKTYMTKGTKRKGVPSICRTWSKRSRNAGEVGAGSDEDDEDDEDDGRGRTFEDGLREAIKEHIDSQATTVDDSPTLVGHDWEMTDEQLEAMIE